MNRSLLMLITALAVAGCGETVSLESNPGTSPRTAVSTERNHPQPEPSRNTNAVTSLRGPTRASTRDWAQWRGPQGNGKSTETGLLHAFPVGGPQILWRAKLGSGFSGIAVADGRVFTLYGDAGRENVACFAADTGKRVWKVETGPDFAQGRSFGPRAMPSCDGELVYAVGANGDLLCLKAANGKKVWSMNLYDKYGMRPHQEGLSPSPLVDGKRLIVAAGTSVFAFDKTNGQQIWKALDEKINHSTPTFATIDGRRQLLVLTGSNLVGLNPESGRELWRHPQRAVNIATPVVGPKDRIFTAAAYGFGCQLVQIENGRPSQVYKNSALATHHATAVLYDGHLYGCHDRLGILKCVEFATGKEKWRTRVPGKGKLIVADGQMIFLNESGILYLAPLSTAGFQPTATVRVLKGLSYTAPTLSAGRLYLRTNREMVCINLKK